MPELIHLVTGFLAAKAPAALILAAFVTTIAYVHSPRLKALVFSIPVPFTCAYIQSGLAINNTHVLGLVLVTSYHWVVYLIVRKMKLPLMLGILSGAAWYVFAMFTVAQSRWLAPLRMPVLFLLLVGGYVAAWGIAAWLYRPMIEPGHRSNAPWYVKSPVIFVVALGIFSLTNLLAGGVTTFPYAGVFTSYEMRHSLRTLAGQYMVNNIAMLLMFVVIWWLEHHGVGMVWRLAAWCVLGASLALIYHVEIGKPPEPVVVGE